MGGGWISGGPDCPAAEAVKVHGSYYRFYNRGVRPASLGETGRPNARCELMADGAGIPSGAEGAGPSRLGLVLGKGWQGVRVDVGRPDSCREGLGSGVGHAALGRLKRCRAGTREREARGLG